MTAAKTKSSELGRPTGDQPSLRERFNAWWEGYELAARPKRERPQPILDLTDTIDPDVDWPTERKAVLQAIWGEGFTGPGGPAYMLSLVKSFGLSSASSIIEIGSGLGGGTRAIAETYGAYVTGWELDPELAAEANTLAMVHSLEKQAEVKRLDLEHIEFRTNFYQGALVHEALYRIEDKKTLLEGLVASVKRGSEVAITELVTAGAGDALNAWIAGEPGEVHLADIREIAELLAEMNVGVRIAEQESEEYMSMIRQGLNRLVSKLSIAPPPKEKLLPTLAEVERWARRVSALESGALRYYRIKGFKS